jgi:aryl-alcohol dehydrogenase-like predicted oxidoreductase
MLYRPLGKTGMRVPQLSFGASSLGSVFRPVTDDQATRTVRTALDLGMTLLDVSPYYGLTLAESRLGAALAGVARDQYLLSTKVGRYGHIAADFDFSPARVIRGLEESLTRLGTDHVDLLLCHDIEYVSLNQIINETLPALAKLQSQGKTRAIGITGLPLKVFTHVLTHSDLLDVLLSYCHYTLNDTALTELLPLVQSRQLGLINAAPTSMGLLTDHPLPSWHPAPAELRRAAANAAALCKSRGTDLATLAIQFSTRHPGIHSTCVGSADPDELKRNVAALETPIDESLLSDVLEILRPVHNLTWLSGLPENN